MKRIFVILQLKWRYGPGLKLWWFMFSLRQKFYGKITFPVKMLIVKAYRFIHNLSI